MPDGGCIPIISRRKFWQEYIRERGMRRSLRNSLLSVNILQKRFKANTRWHKPRSMWSHSGRGMIRGIRSKREESFGAAAVAIHRKRDALKQEGQIGELAALLELRHGHGGELVEYLLVVRPGRALGREHLVVERPRVVISKEIAFVRSGLGRVGQQSEV
jgi:hypothetical protein